MITHTILILDKSGSMSPLTNDTIGGFNGYLDNLDGDSIKVSAMLFDTDFKVLFRDKSPKKATRLNHQNYQAFGNTALYDAVGKSLEELEFPQEDKVLFVVITDGQENSSREFTSEQVKNMIAKKEELNWGFLYLSAGLDAWADSRKIGVQYTAYVPMRTSYDTQMLYKNLTTATNSFQNVVSTGGSVAAASATALNEFMPTDPLGNNATIWGSK